MKKLKFLMAIHSHQPVGNFDHVFEEAYAKAYLPFLEALEGHPHIRMALHYSGSLIDWIEIHKPEFIYRIGQLVKREQVELLSCGYYEPILALLPDEDKIGQIKMMNERISKIWGFQAKGAWLTERIWEPALAKVFSDIGINYTLVDDTHFEKAGKNAEDLGGYYVTEEEGRKLNIFPGSKFLRYALPFKLPEESIKYFRTYLDSGKEAISFADDGEKFGLWPHTYKWVYEEKWLEKFFSIIEDNSDWIEMITFKEYIQTHPPSGMIYLPCASYSEMLEWSDGYFRNFLVKYPEANNMHKKMLEVSKKVSLIARQTSTANYQLSQVQRYLYMGQSNDSYWHGVFGGLYLNHLRHSVYSNLIKAENAIDAIAHRQNNRLEHVLSDFDCDGKEELVLENSKLKAYIDIAEKASIFELDHKERTINLINTLARRKEKYHEKIKEKLLKKSYATVAGTASIHDLEKSIPEGLDKFLVYDLYRKSCLREYLFKNSDISLESFLRGNFIEIDDPPDEYILNSVENKDRKLSAMFKRHFQADTLQFELEKIIAMEPDSSKLNFQYIITNQSESYWEGKFGVEFNFSLWDPGLVVKGEQDGIHNLSVKDSWFGMKIDFMLDKATRLWHFPVETVYESESGFEKNFQALGILFHWDIGLKPKQRWDISLIQDIIS